MEAVTAAPIALQHHKYNDVFEDQPSPTARLDSLVALAGSVGDRLDVEDNGALGPTSAGGNRRLPKRHGEGVANLGQLFDDQQGAATAGLRSDNHDGTSAAAAKPSTYAPPTFGERGFDASGARRLGLTAPYCRVCCAGGAWPRAPRVPLHHRPPCPPSPHPSLQTPQRQRQRLLLRAPSARRTFQASKKSLRTRTRGERALDGLWQLPPHLTPLSVSLCRGVPPPLTGSGLSLQRARNAQRVDTSHAEHGAHQGRSGGGGG